MRSKTGQTLLVLALLMTACGEESGDDPEGYDGAVDPSTTPDGGKQDSGASDAGGGLDATVGQDASTVVDAAADSAALDGATDAASTDAAAADAAAPDAAVAATTFTRVHAIITANCKPCHVGGSSGNLTLTTKAGAYAALVGSGSGIKAMGGECGGPTTTRIRVVKGSPDTSLLIHKLEGGSNLCGAQMPKGKTPLSSALIGEVRSWIAAGALDN